MIWWYAVLYIIASFTTWSVAGRVQARKVTKEMAAYWKKYYEASHYYREDMYPPNFLSPMQKGALAGFLWPVAWVVAFSAGFYNLSHAALTAGNVRRLMTGVPTDPRFDKVEEPA